MIHWCTVSLSAWAVLLDQLVVIHVVNELM